MKIDTQNTSAVANFAKQNSNDGQEVFDLSLKATSTDDRNFRLRADSQTDCLIGGVVFSLVLGC